MSDPVFAVRTVDGSMAIFDAERYSWIETESGSLAVRTFVASEHDTGPGKLVEVARFAAGEWSGAVDMEHLSTGTGGYAS